MISVIPALRNANFSWPLSLLQSSLLSTAPMFLQPKFFWDIWALSRLPFLRVALSYHGFPVMLDSPVMNCQTRSPKPEQHFPSPMFPARYPCHCKDKAHPLNYLMETKAFSQFYLLPDSFGFLRGTGPYPYRPL